MMALIDHPPQLGRSHPASPFHNFSFQSGNLYLGSTLALQGEQPINRGCSSASNHEKHGNREHKQMIFVTFALLASGPVHKESELMMNHSDGHDHIGEDSQRRDSGQESQNEAESAKEFRAYGQESE